MKKNMSALIMLALGSCLAMSAGTNAKGKDNDKDNDSSNHSACSGLPDHATVRAVLDAATNNDKVGFKLQMWGAVVNRDGVVCVVAFTGEDRGAQWPGSRVIAAQKANTANAFSLSGLALSTANLYSAVQPGGSLFGLQESNPVDVSVAYRGSSSRYGQHNDPMVGGKIGGVNVFGGGLGLYNADGKLVGGIGVSGDTSCADHIVAWRLRHGLNLDNVPAGVSPSGDDNFIDDTAVDPVTGHTTSAGGFGHPLCGNAEELVIGNLPIGFPIGPAP